MGEQAAHSKSGPNPALRLGPRTASKVNSRVSVDRDMLIAQQVSGLQDRFLNRFFENQSLHFMDKLLL